MAENKINYGLSRCYYAVASISTSGTASYDTPVALPGAINLSLSQEGSTNPNYGDNIVWYETVANNGYSGSLELYNIPKSFDEDIFGNYVDKNGNYTEIADAEPVHFALLFQFEGDAHQTQHVLYNCIAQRPDVASSTKEDSISAATKTINITARTIFDSTTDKNIVKMKSSDTTPTSISSAWFTSVQMPAATT